VRAPELCSHSTWPPSPRGGRGLRPGRVWRRRPRHDLDPDEQRAAGLAVALITAIIAATRRAARASARLDPPVLVALDEAANTAPLHTSTSLLSSGRRIGICTIVAFQSLGRPVRPTAATRASPSSATSPRSSSCEDNADDPRDLGDPLGQHNEEVMSVSHQPGGFVLWSSASMQRHTRRRPVLTTDELRTLGHTHPGEVLVIPRAAKTMRTRLPAVWERDPTGVT
jgi:type IV secretion system protein VirD4